MIGTHQANPTLFKICRGNTHSSYIHAGGNGPLDQSFPTEAHRFLLLHAAGTSSMLTSDTEPVFYTHCVYKTVPFTLHYDVSGHIVQNPCITSCDKRVGDIDQIVEESLSETTAPPASPLGQKQVLCFHLAWRNVELSLDTNAHHLRIPGCKSDLCHRPFC
jgi:hypothetical protein